jgi:hypothetical protein
MMNDWVNNQIGLISPPLRNAYLYKSSSELGKKIGFGCVNMAPERTNENKKRMING